MVDWRPGEHGVPWQELAGVVSWGQRGARNHEDAVPAAQLDVVGLGSVRPGGVRPTPGVHHSPAARCGGELLFRSSTNKSAIRQQRGSNSGSQSRAGGGGTYAAWLARRERWHYIGGAGKAPSSSDGGSGGVEGRPWSNEQGSRRLLVGGWREDR
mmetsp:Transcript_33210/g.105673  ORF Transcript_33210/g.105673 Transcript_33210/m.105673 type:complete len:155 (-) Transcript_33210:1873-2337(-)